MTFILEYKCNLPNPELKMRASVSKYEKDRERNSFGKWSTPYPLEVVLLTVGGVGNSVQFTLSAS